MNQTHFILCLLLFISACDPNNTEITVPLPVPAVSPGSPGYLRLPMNGAVTTLDPGLTEDLASIELTEQLFLALTGFDPKTYEVVPELATHWQVYDEGRRYRFYLRDNVFWSDGQAVTAADIVWAIQRNIAPVTNSPYASALYVLEHAEDLHLGHSTDFSRLGVQALDNYTVEFQLKTAVSHFPALVSLWVYRPLPRSAIERWGEYWTLPGKLISNGPYQLASWQRGKQLTLRKNPYYYAADKVEIREVRYLTIVESSLGLSMYQHNELDVMGGLYLALPQDELDAVKQDPDLHDQYWRQPLLCSESYAFNVQRAPMDDVRVRKAITAAIDRDLLVQAFLQDSAQATSAFIPLAGTAAMAQDEQGIGFDPERAQTWLAEAGYPDGKGFPSLTLAYNTSEMHHKVALAAQKMLSHYLNITLNLQEMPWLQYMQAIMQPGTPHLFRFGWCADYPNPASWLSGVAQPAIAVHRLGWINTDFVQQMEHTLSQMDPVAREQDYRLLEQQLLAEQVVIMPLYFQTAQYLVKPWVHDWHAMPFGGQPVKDWRLVN